MTYRSVHRRLDQQRGPAHTHPCARCGRPAAEWAYDGRDRREVYDLPPIAPPLFAARRSPRRYSLDPAHYLPLCRTCHRDLDAPTHCRAGHSLDDPANVYRWQGRPRERLCRTCRRDRIRRYRHTRTTERNHR